MKRYPKLLKTVKTSKDPSSMVVTWTVNILDYPLSPLVCLLKHPLIDDDPDPQVTSVKCRYWGELQRRLWQNFASRYQGVLQCPQGCQGSTQHVQPAASPTQLSGSNRLGQKLCLNFLMKFLVEYHVLNWSMRKYC